MHERTSRQTDQCNDKLLKKKNTPKKLQKCYSEQDWVSHCVLLYYKMLDFWKRYNLTDTEAFYDVLSSKKLPEINFA